MAGQLSRDQLKRIADDVAGVLLDRLQRELGEGAAGQMVGWDCTGPKFTCGDYTCTGVVGCSGDFGCTIKFTGFTRA